MVGRVARFYTRLSSEYSMLVIIIPSRSFNIFIYWIGKRRVKCGVRGTAYICSDVGINLDPSKSFCYQQEQPRRVFTFVNWPLRSMSASLLPYYVVNNRSAY